MTSSSHLKSRRGSTLLVVVVFLSLLTVVILGFLARSVLELQISDSNSNILASESYGRGSIDQIIGALKQEIVAGSQVSVGGVQVSPLNSGNSRLYCPSVPATSVPYNGGPSSPGSNYWSTFPNLVKESIHGVPFYPSTNYDSNGSSLLTAAAVSTTSESSRLASGSIAGADLNGGFISAAVWNSHLLLPKASVTFSGGTGGTSVSITDSGTDPTPNSSFIAPDWIFTAADGSNPTTFNAAAMSNSHSSTFVVGRYAYAIYNEGGLLDANVAGSPAAPSVPYQPIGGNVSTVKQSTVLSRKGPTSFADLTQLPGIANATSMTPQSVVDQIVGWRNYSSGQPSGVFPSYSLSNSINKYLTFVQGLSTQSMENGATSLYQGGTDHFFTSRKQLISFMENLSTNAQTQAYLQDSLMYLGTFSRSLNRPSYWPDPSPSRPLVTGPGYPECGTSNTPYGNNAYQKDGPFIAGTSSAGSINPPFENIRVTQSFIRNDGSMAVVGDPLVSKRFALNRLAWITYKGPISAVSASDALFTQYQNLGIPPSMITQWTTEGTTSNIKSFFGLTWNVGPAGANQPGGYWVYDPDGDEPSSSVMIKTLDQVAAERRDPTFFELLKASIMAGSLAKGGLPLLEQGTTAPDYSFLCYRDTRVDYHIFQIGANILNQASPANYPLQIVVYDNTSAIKANQSFVGITDVPYLYETINEFIENVVPIPAPSSLTVSPQLTLTNPGKVVELQIPIIWNPHSPGASSYLGGLTPTKFRIGVSDAVWPTISTVSPPAGYYNIGVSYNSATAVLLNPPNLSPTYSPYDAAPFNSLIAPWGNQHGYPTGPFPTTGTWTSSAGYGTNVSSLLINPVSNSDSYALATGWVDFSPATKAGVCNTEIYFDGDATGNTTLYREPTPLMYSTGSAASAAGTYLDSNNVLRTVGGFLTPYVTDALSPSPPSLNYLGFFEAEFPLCWNYTDTAVTPNTTTTYSVNTVGGSNANGMGITYSLEYQVGSTWIPYEQNNLFGEQDSPFGGGTSSTITGIPTTTSSSAPGYFWPNTSYKGVGTVTWDPRSVRWAGSNGVGMGSFVTAGNSATELTIQTARPTTTTGQTLHGWCVGAFSKDQDISAQRSPIVVSNFSNSLGYAPDADSVVRRPMGAYTPSSTPSYNASSPIGLPMATVYPSATSTTTQNGSNRPIILHRPFRSVAELGYVFSDTPWRNLDFFTPESGCAALLDVFCIDEDYQPDALTAGRVDLNTKQAPVIQALLAGAYRDETDPNLTSINNLSVSEAAAIAQALVKRTTGVSTVIGGASATGPLSNIADLVGRYTSTAAVTSNNPGVGVPYDGFSGDLSVYTGGSGTASSSSVYNITQRFRETTMRALSDAGQAGTWNLLIDVVAQVGRYPASAKSPDQFLVKGVRHYWVHVAIDRTTGQVIDENIEVVNQ